MNWMFWKKKPEEKELLEMYVDKKVFAEEILGWLKMPQAENLLNWLENLEYALKMGTFDKEDITEKALTLRRGEIRALKILRAKISDIRNVKPETDETEETNG